MRNTLLSAVSHDLRTPLAAITGAATALRDDWASVSAGERADLLDTVCQEAERLERLVANLLDMTRLEAGGLRLKREWVPLEELVGAALTRLDAKLGARKIVTSLPADLPLVSVDPVLLQQVLLNLLENAAKYTPPGSPIDIWAEATEATVVLCVGDRGLGIGAGDEERVFEKFFRGSHAGVSGVGLGLAICRGIVEAHGGTIRAENRAGGGAMFRIALPIVGRAPALPPDSQTPLAPEEATS